MKGRVCHGFGSGPHDNPECSAASKVKVKIGRLPNGRIHGTKGIFTRIIYHKKSDKCG